MNITGKTRITGLFGYPVEHTLSPAMHNAAFAETGLDYCYVPFLVHPENLGSAVASVKALSMAGVNVTVPHKEAVIPLLDQVDSEAAFIGAVNTVVHRDGKLSGYNTDGRGFMKSLEEAGVDVGKKRILVVGAGGASRAIGYYLSETAEALCITDIDGARLVRLAADLSRIRSNVQGVGSPENLNDFDIVINATPLGLKPSDPSPVDLSALRPEQTVCDLIYKKTPLLEGAAARGCRTVSGLGMLLWQGVLAFELWTLVRPPVEVMRNALLQGMR